MPHQQRAIAQHIVDILVAVDIVDFGALRFGDEGRGGAHGPIGADRAVDAAGHETLGFSKGGSGFFEIKHNMSPKKFNLTEDCLITRRKPAFAR